MANVLIVGFGNIGLRHCESLINFDKIKKIFIYDKNYKKLIDFKKKFKNSKKIIILKNLNKNKLKFFLSIIATNSNVRFSVFKKLVNNFNIESFIFEKIVFQKEKEYDLATKIILKKKLKCWINCPRRTWLIFTKLKKKISKDYKTSIIVRGNNWSILSNSIHFIDLFAYLTEKYDISFSLNKLNKQLNKTKRIGFYDSFGEILVKNNSNDKLFLIEKKNKSKFFTFKLSNHKTNFFFDQNNPKNIFKVPYQSDETIKHVRNILKNGDCKLPSYLKTYELHKKYSQNINSYFKNRKNFLFT